jgi:hypothetical protein
VQIVYEHAQTPTDQRRSCSEHGIPDFRRAAIFDAKRSKFELTFPDPVHEFDPGDGDRGVSEPLQSEHRAQAKLDRPMRLFKYFDDLIFVRAPPRCWAALVHGYACAVS